MGISEGLAFVPNPVGHCLAALVAMGFVAFALGWPLLGPWPFLSGLAAVVVEGLSIPYRPRKIRGTVALGAAFAWLPALLLLLDLVAPGVALALGFALAVALTSSVALDGLFTRLEERGHDGGLPHLALHGACLGLFLVLLALTP